MPGPPLRSLFIFLFVIVLVGCGRDKEAPSTPSDTAPSAVTDLAASAYGDSTIVLTWSAPGDDGASGRASAYDVRHSTGAISGGTWESAAQAGGEPDPGAAGSRETLIVSGLEPSTLYYVALRSQDDAGNTSGLSNVAEVTTNETLGGHWTAFGSDGLNGQASVFMSFGNSLVVGGDFTQAGPVPALRVAAWDGAGWSAFGAGLSPLTGDASVAALAEYNGELIAGGHFVKSGLATVSYLARWDGAAWNALGLGADLTVGALAVYGGDLYAGGSFYTMGAKRIHALARWDGAAWHSMGWREPGVTGVTALAAHNGSLFVGGRFDNAGGAPSPNIARWDD